MASSYHLFFPVRASTEMSPLVDWSPYGSSLFLESFLKASLQYEDYVCVTGRRRGKSPDCHVFVY